MMLRRRSGKSVEHVLRTPSRLRCWWKPASAPRYLLSGLDGETVEDMGLGYVSSEDEIGHLCQQFDSCLLLADAHRAGVAVEEDL
jgi:hypothetical protein